MEWINSHTKRDANPGLKHELILRKLGIHVLKTNELDDIDITPKDTSFSNEQNIKVYKSKVEYDSQTYNITFNNLHETSNDGNEFRYKTKIVNSDNFPSGLLETVTCQCSRTGSETSTEIVEKLRKNASAKLFEDILELGKPNAEDAEILEKLRATGFTDNQYTHNLISRALMIALKRNDNEEMLDALILHW
jgi:hypothetical protein